ncbi:MAG: outer membrane lipoprotein carrier protein LolA [Sneathiella sp.]|nr:outer membrane lipoprotein carrier protein LolA [Sneathiella sp.]
MRPLFKSALAIILSSTLLISANATAAKLTDDDREDIARVEAYLNKITTLKAHFLQVNSEGHVAEGNVLINRPGRARFEYEPPAQILVVADGTWLVFHDKELDETTRIPLSATPISVLLEEDVELSGDVTVTSVEKDGGILRVNIIDTDEPDEGGITLVFTLHPFALRKWLITDPQGSTTSVSLSNMERGLEFKAELFTFYDASYD